MKNNLLISNFFWIPFIFVIGLSSQKGKAQTLEKPLLGFVYACPSNGFNSFNAIISYDLIFNSDNEFIVELSGPEGSFDTPTILKTITDQNFSFEFETNFSFPTAVAGENYKIRIRSTSPEQISPESNIFHAFFVPDTNLILNNYEDIVACGATTATLSLNVDIAASYLWFKNGFFYKEGGSSIEVDTSGEYYVTPYFGDCTGKINSNIVIVDFGEEIIAQIQGGDIAEACPGETHTFIAAPDNEFYNYQWYKDGVLLENLPEYTPQLGVAVSDATYGNYKVVIISSSGCETTSNTITLKAPDVNDTVEAASPTENILIGNEPLTLQVTTSITNPQVMWYKDGALISNETGLTIQVNEPGEYIAKIAVAGACVETINSSLFKIEAPTSFAVSINHADTYEACSNTSSTLQLTSLVAISPNFEVVLEENSYNQFSFEWFLDQEAVGSTSTTHVIEDYNQNGSYQLQATYKNVNYTSNTLQVSLGLPQVSLNTNAVVLCQNGDTIILEASHYEEVSYVWYKDNINIGTTLENSVEINEPGIYHVEVIKDNCVTKSDEFAITLFDENAITVSPSDVITITKGGSQVITASGATSYRWQNEEGLTLSSSGTFAVSEEGVYTLIATEGTCEVIKTITVTEVEVVMIPNIISPNQDNINDLWVLPPQFTNDPEVEVLIYDTYGSLVLRTRSYQNNWPESSSIGEAEASIYYYFIQKNDTLLEKGSLTVVNR
ncbi:gliding motility-associated C-terminal domain-containing protein [Leptobacterium sp. I13]|uniref:T9SS type B sorting domain-containing protein n=1 Tax=Leptobacterium meishanense TaxID=3128904 RepID=UPI0030EB6FE0